MVVPMFMPKAEHFQRTELPHNDTPTSPKEGTDSTTSLPLSIPYAYIMNNTSSLDTVNLLDNNETKRYSNTSHLKGYPILIRGQSQEKFYNQVPKRFSHFIEDQKSPKSTWEDVFADTSTKGSSTKELYPHSSMGKSTPRNSSSKFTTTAETQSVNSKGTIFSTRKNRQMMLKSGKNKNRKGKIQLYETTSGSSTLSRRSAIKFKEGSWAYRLKVRLKKMLKKLRIFRLNNFRASSRRSKLSDKTRTYDLTARNPSLRYREGPNRRSVKALVRSKTVSSRLNRNPRGQSFQTRNNQGQTYVQVGQYPLTQEGYETHSETLKRKPELDCTESLSSDGGSIPPPPPPHLVHDRLQYPFKNTNDVSDLWRKYLLHVIGKRIQLRQEIHTYQRLSESYESFGEEDEPNDAMDDNSNKSSTHSFFSEERQHSEFSYSGASSNSTDATDLENGDIFVDPPTEVFRKAYKRDSIMNNMLDIGSVADTLSDYDLSPPHSSTKWNNLSNASAMNAADYARLQIHRHSRPDNYVPV